MKRRRGLLLFVTLSIALCVACGVWLHGQQQQYQLSRQLISALKHRDANAALKLDNAGADPNTRQYAPPAPTLKFLLTHLFNHKPVPYVDSDTALMLACGIPTQSQSGAGHRWVSMEENLPLLTAMLEHGVNVRAGTELGNTPLHIAAGSGRARTVDLLLKHGANIDAQNISGTTPLGMALTEGASTVVHLLLTQGANPNLQDRVGETALFDAIISPQAHSAIPDLLAHGADPNHRNEDGDTPLHIAQEEGFADIVRLLKEKAK